MAKPIKAYQGGIQFRVQYAVRADGVCFRRLQSRTGRGYSWSAWKIYSVLDAGALPDVMSAGFSSCYPADSYSGWQKWRLPND